MCEQTVEIEYHPAHSMVRFLGVKTFAPFPYCLQQAFETITKLHEYTMKKFKTKAKNG